jgi:hypothetical protein
MIPQQYIRPHALDQKTKTVAAAIFNGSFNDDRVDARASCCLHKGLLIKDITANLLCRAMTREFPHIKPILLIRNPFAVALSKFNTRQWVWLTEPLEFLKQKALSEDFLQPFEDIIKKTSAEKNYFLNQILIWAILHYVPLRQFKADDIHICFYEDMYTAPEREITRIMRFAKGDQTIATVNLADTLVRQPSWVSGQKSNMAQGTSPITSWKNELDPAVITQGLAILNHFGLADLYQGDGIPAQEALKKIQGQKRLWHAQYCMQYRQHSFSLDEDAGSHY